MSTKPTTVPRWASDETNNDAPSSGQMDTGWTPGQDGVSDYDNWWKNFASQWCQYLSDGAFQGSFQFASVITPSSISSGQNNYNPTGLSTAQIIRQDLSADATLTGLAGGADGRVIILINISSSFDLVISHQNAGSTTTNRFIVAGAGFPSNSGLTLKAGQNDAVVLIYDGTTERWRVMSAAADTHKSLHTLVVSPHSGHPDFSGIEADWDPSGTVVTLGNGNGGSYNYPVNLDAGCVIREVRARIQRNTNSSWSMDLFKVTDSSASSVASGNTLASGSTAWATSTASAVDEVVETGSHYLVRITTGSTVDADTDIGQVEIDYYEP